MRSPRSPRRSASTPRALTRRRLSRRSVSCTSRGGRTSARSGTSPPSSRAGRPTLPRTTRSPISSRTRGSGTGRSQIYRAQYDDAHAEADALLASRPAYGHYTYWKGIVFFYEGDLPESRRWIERGYQLDPDNFIAKGVLAFILAHHGEEAEARRHLALAERGAAADGTFTYWLAKVRAALGDEDAAVEWIGRAEAIGYWNAPWIARDRALAPLGAHPGFALRLASIEDRQKAFAASVAARIG